MADIGSSLREARMRAHIDISEVEVRTKIRAKYLRALENEEWSLLPGPVYVRSFLKTYGDYLGLDSRLLVDEFKRRYEIPSEHEQRASAARSRERDRSRGPARVSRWFISPISLIVVSLVVIVVALYLLGSHETSGPATVGASAHPTKRGKSTATDPPKKHHVGPRKHTATTPAGSSTGTGSNTTPVVSSTVATLAMKFTSTVWVCVESAAGKPLYTGEHTAGESMPTESGQTLLVDLGNNHVTMTVNGKAYTPPVGSPIGLKITPAGVTSLSPAPTCQ